ncbi:MCE family protein [Nocardioides immobilis]|uniref:MCE family protein n=1 Tax=Nocardioides immobilis TaxID=2049295 RepID=A0A417Y7U0_9ACTN|nr:MlaD family protein [Nocardioides immobilis]RHW28524.1 MCE family protein [Nocardioides immobilis]
MTSKRTLLAAASALVLAIAAAIVLLQDGSDDDIEVVAVFEDASPLVPGNVVKAAGVDVGEVTDVELEDGAAQVTMRLDARVLPLHEDATATITTQDLLGERFVRLDRGSPDAPALATPMVIPAGNTARVVDLQDVLNSVDTPASVALAALVTELGEGLRGRGKQADQAIAALAPAMRQTEDLADILNDQNELLTTLVENAEPVARALGADDGRQLDRLVESATTLLAIVASERGSLELALQNLPQTIRSSRAALVELSAAAGPARRTLQSLRPITDDLDDISGELLRFADAADPALGALPPVLRKAEDLLQEAAPVVAALRPAARDLVPASSAGARLTTTALSGQSLTDLMEFVKGWSLATSDYDAISHYFKAMVPLSPAALDDTAAGIVPGLPDDLLDDVEVPTAPNLEGPGRDDGPRQGPVNDVLDDVLDLDGLLGGLGGNRGSAERQSATGLSAQQEENLLEQLLGGVSR